MSTDSRLHGGQWQATAELSLELHVDAVPQARHFARARLSGRGELTDGVELIVTELVTNAILYGQAPICLRLRELPDGVRVEVCDGGGDLIALPVSSLDAMTGRGLALVRSLSRSWGVDHATAAGKTVWAEVTPASACSEIPLGEVNVDELLNDFRDADSDAEPVHTVRLGRVPTDFLLAAKNHIDNLVREFTLARSGPVPPELAKLVKAVTVDWAAVRAEIRRQAIAAANRGETETDLVLHQPASAADAGGRYLAALEEADRYARSARLLTLEATPRQRLFHRWYVQTLIDRIRADRSTTSGPAQRTFQQALEDEANS